MAPKGMKRPAAAVAAPATKRARISSEMKGKLDEIAEAISSYEGLPAVVRTMLCAVLKDTLPILKDSRHKYQSDAVDMIAESLAGAEAALEKNIASVKEKVDGADAEKAALEESEKAAKEELEKLKGLTVAAKEASEADAKTSAEATVALKQAKHDQEAGDASCKKLEEDKTKLESTFNEVFKPMLEAAASGKEGLKTLEKVCKEFKFDPSMIETVLTAVKDEPASRGTFAKMAEKQFESHFTELISAKTAELEEYMPGKAQRAEVVAAKEAEFAAAQEKAKAAKEALDAAVAAEKEGAKALAEKAKAAASFLPELKKTCKALDTAQKTLAAFKKGPLEAFNSLKDLAPPPPEPEPVPEPVPEPEAPAPADVAAEPAATEAEAPAPADVAAEPAPMEAEASVPA